MGPVRCERRIPTRAYPAANRLTASTDVAPTEAVQAPHDHPAAAAAARASGPNGPMIGVLPPTVVRRSTRRYLA